MLSNRPDIRTELGLRPVINVSGTMTSLGASIVVPEAIEPMSRMLPEFVEITDLQRKAIGGDRHGVRRRGGDVTASASAGITVAVAGCHDRRRPRADRAPARHGGLGAQRGR